MPLYDYECSACGKKFEVVQKMSDDPIKICPSCGAESAHRVLSPEIGISFVGSGFYVNDSQKA